MPSSIGKVIQQSLKDKGFTCSLTGSSVIGGFVEGISDYDIVVNITDTKEDPLYHLQRDWGIRLTYSGSAEHDSLTKSWKGLYKGQVINLILIEDPVLYKAWFTATEVTKGLNIHHKPTRIEFFQHFKGLAHKKISSDNTWSVDLSAPF